MAVSNFVTTLYTVGDGSIEKLRDYQEERIGLVVDDNIMKALNLDQLLYNDIFANTEHKLLCNVPTEPTIAMMKVPVQIVREFMADRIIGIGGGAVMDVAKALKAFTEHSELTWEEALIPYNIKEPERYVNLTVIPTTSGTGSETTGCSVMKDEENRKRMILSKQIIPTEAILDFTLLQSLPMKNIAYSGADALAHALESAISLRSNPMVKEISCQAAVTVIKYLAASYKGDMNARKKVHIAASMAGMGIGNAGTGMAHGMDQPGGDFHLPHGLMTGLALPYTMKYLMPQPEYIEVAEQLGISGTDEEKQQKLIQAVFELYRQIGMPMTLDEIGIPRDKYMEKIGLYADRALQDANIINCPKNPNKEELEQIYLSFYTGIFEGGNL